MYRLSLRQRNNLKEEAVALRELSAVFLAREDVEIAIDAVQDPERDKWGQP